jgi:hypothetical protein
MFDPNRPEYLHHEIRQSRLIGIKGRATISPARGPIDSGQYQHRETMPPRLQFTLEQTDKPSSSEAVKCMATTSAGILMNHGDDDGIDVFLVHPAPKEAK